MQLTPVGLPVDGPMISIPGLTFEKAIEKMVEGFERGFMTFMLIEHGHFLGSFDNPVGLTMPLASDTSVLATEEVFVELRRLKELQPGPTKAVDPKKARNLQTNSGLLEASILLRIA